MRFNGALLVLQVLGEAVIASNVLMAGGTGTVALQTCQFSPPPPVGACLRDVYV